MGERYAEHRILVIGESHYSIKRYSGKKGYCAVTKELFQLAVDAQD